MPPSAPRRQRRCSPSPRRSRCSASRIIGRRPTLTHMSDLQGRASQCSPTLRRPCPPARPTRPHDRDHRVAGGARRRQFARGSHPASPAPTWRRRSGAGKTVTTSRPHPEAFATRLPRRGRTRRPGCRLGASERRHLRDLRRRRTCRSRRLPIPVTVVDSRTLAMALGFAVLRGAEAAAAGASVAEVGDVIRRQAEASVAYFCVDSLEYLRRGGRIGAAQALIGSALAVKPLLTVADGVVRPYERVRTRAKAVGRLEDLAVSRVRRGARWRAVRFAWPFTIWTTPTQAASWSDRLGHPPARARRRSADRGVGGQCRPRRARRSRHAGRGGLPGRRPVVAGWLSPGAVAGRPGYPQLAGAPAAFGVASLTSRS